MEVLFHNVRELVDRANKEQKLISEIMIEQEMLITGRSREEIMAQMDRNLTVMEEAVEKGLNGVQSTSGLTGGDAVLLQDYMKKGNLIGELMLDAVSKAVATNEVNAAMGTICATPTAGSAGVVPGTLFAVKNKLNPTREQMIRYLFNAGHLDLSLRIMHRFLVLQVAVKRKLDQQLEWLQLQLLKWLAVHRNKALKHLQLR